MPVSRSANRIPFHITVPPEWLDSVRSSASAVNLSMTSFIVCAIAEAMRRGTADRLAMDGAERNPTWAKSAVKPPSRWQQIQKGVIQYGDFFLEKLTREEANGTGGWYLTGPGTYRRYTAKVRAEAEELALGYIVRLLRKEDEDASEVAPAVHEGESYE